MDWAVDHSDLWQRVDAALNCRPTGSVVVTKVQGHAKKVDVLTGIISQPNRDGNSQADMLATQGAAEHAVDRRVVQLSKARTLLARSVQALMVDILEARNKARTTSTDEVIDLTLGWTTVTK